MIGPKCLPRLERSREQTWGGIGRRPHRWAVTSKATPDGDLHRDLDRGIQRGRGGLDAEQQPPPRAQRRVLFSGAAGCGSRSGNRWPRRVLFSVAAGCGGRSGAGSSGRREGGGKLKDKREKGWVVASGVVGVRAMQANVVFPFFHMKRSTHPYDLWPSSK
jgi:hypothetical protein